MAQSPLMAYACEMKHELIVEKYVRKAMSDSYWFGVGVGVIAGLALGFMIGYGLA